MCGLAGIVSTTPRAFDYQTFTTLGMANDVRGGDSCGIFIDGQYDYGVDKTKLFCNFFPGNQLLDSVQYSQIAFVHCRKASVGKINRETAQPVIITEDDKVKFVVLHNGTIYNYEELAQKYIPEIDIKDMTDSQVMAQIFYYAGYKALGEYNGGSCFVIADYRGASPKVFLFKGESKRAEYCKEVEEERPLCYTIDRSKKELVFCSLGLWLLSVRSDNPAYILEGNVLFEFTGTALKPVEAFDRSRCCQSKAVTYTRTKALNRDFFPLQDDYSYGNYITQDLVKNRYTLRAKPVHGRVYINSFGKVSEVHNKECSEIWFFNGIPLKSSSCFRFIVKLINESKLNLAEFCRKFECLIRYLSITPVYKVDGIWMEATSPTDTKRFTGEFSMIGSSAKNIINDGVLQQTTYGGYFVPLEEILVEGKMDFDRVKKQCKPLMK